ncbi:MAG TPA: sigma-70 family RNA polymerase sigma factor [Planctomycetaceae bacterium]|nr:sigma-70 family RNA polymerase sigma factor [Planctomycetaceae bacterium]
MERDMIEDTELLRRYAEEHSEAAFTELVERRLGLVYAVALRQTGGDAHRAQDIAQTVFTHLARKASSLARQPVLAGWLYRSAQFAASDAMRTEWRRQVREQEAHTMNEILSEDRPAGDWDKLRPDLDQVLSELDESDRDALVLRFFDDRSFVDVGAKLNLTENAARMRVQRALEKVRALLARRG